MFTAGGDTVADNQSQRFTRIDADERARETSPPGNCRKPYTYLCRTIAQQRRGQGFSILEKFPLLVTLAVRHAWSTAQIVHNQMSTLGKCLTLHCLLRTWLLGRGFKYNIHRPYCTTSDRWNNDVQKQIEAGVRPQSTLFFADHTTISPKPPPSLRIFSSNHDVRTYEMAPLNRIILSIFSEV